MGHQLNYYMTPTDLESAASVLQSASPFVILNRRSTLPQPQVVESFDVKEEGAQVLFFAIVRPEDLASVVMEHVPEQGHWLIDGMRSPTVDVGRCYFDGKILRRSREYYVDGYYGPDGTWMWKSEAFRTWAKSILSRTRRWLKNKAPDGYYIGPDAASFAAAGGKLVQL